MIITGMKISGKNTARVEIKKPKPNEYNGTGGIKKEIFGTNKFFGTSFTPVQTLEYSYDTRGVLYSINDLSNVVNSLSGGNNSPHFGLSLSFQENPQHQYYNGRVAGISSKLSGDGTLIDHNYKYTYNDLGWLTFADNELDPTMDQTFKYDKFGNRVEFTDVNGTISYEYYEIVGSSKLKKYTGMNFDMQYDQIGNLVSDVSNGIYSMSYDYRNLLTYSNFESITSGANYDYLDMRYDESGNRISKIYHYQYWSTCGGIDPPPNELNSMIVADSLNSINLGLGGEMQALGSLPGPGGTYPCLKTTGTAVYYLYDNGNLVATFDGSDKVIDIFINGPKGKIASYHENDESKLYYYFNDFLGSSRVVMHQPIGMIDPPVVVSSTNYHPYGEIAYNLQNFDSPFKFTGKERDSYSNSFNYDNYGARFYNPKIGQFNSVDKMGQFASGFLYAGNNPITVVDPDGNWSFNRLWDDIRRLLGIELGYEQDQNGGRITLSKVTGFGLGSSIQFYSYSLGGESGFYPKSSSQGNGLPGVFSFYKGNNLVYSFVSNVAEGMLQTGAINAVMGRDITSGFDMLFLSSATNLSLQATSSFVYGLLSSSHNLASLNEWSEDQFDKYKEFVKARLLKYIEEGREFTCDDLQFSLMADFAYENKLPFKISTGAGDRDLWDYDDVDDFKNALLNNAGHKELLENTSSIKFDDARVGDMIAFDGGLSDYSHSQVITSISANMELIKINQGNFNWLGGFFGSSDPTSIRYLGVPIQEGHYILNNGSYSYKRFYGNFNTLNNYLKNKSYTIRRWNYNKWVRE